MITGRTLIRPAMGFLIDIQITQLFNFILKTRACPFSMYDVLDAKRRYSFVDNINMPFPMIESFPKLCDSHHSNSRHFSCHFLYRLSWWRLAPLLATRQALRQKLPLLLCEVVDSQDGTKEEFGCRPQLKSRHFMLFVEQSKSNSAKRDEGEDGQKVPRILVLDTSNYIKLQKMQISVFCG